MAKKGNHVYYNSISSGYEELHKAEQEAKLAIIKANMTIKPTDKLLDVGCGTGITSRFSESGCLVVGADPAIKLLKKAEKNSLKNRVCAEAEHLPFKDNSFDITISITAIQNFHDIRKGLEEIKRVGKNKFALTFLKRSQNKDVIINNIKKIFKVQKEMEEEKDIMMIAVK
ncbi:MAG: methyltransferase domain-containing protein [Candidatus Woesearchaeota archaeon]|nr:methyltransferase domain-containing protein [Candidatus Woesearchaeota archaeon]